MGTTLGAQMSIEYVKNKNKVRIQTVHLHRPARSEIPPPQDRYGRGRSQVPKGSNHVLLHPTEARRLAGGGPRNVQQDLQKTNQRPPPD